MKIKIFIEIRILDLCFSSETCTDQIILIIKYYMHFLLLAIVCINLVTITQLSLVHDFKLQTNFSTCLPRWMVLIILLQLANLKFLRWGQFIFKFGVSSIVCISITKNSRKTKLWMKTVSLVYLNNILVN